MSTKLMPQRRSQCVSNRMLPHTTTNSYLVNNISTCLAQQTPPDSTSAITMSSAPSDFPVSNSAPRTLLIEQAQQWASRALARAAQIKGSDRTEECDMGCAVATHNLGEFFEMQGKVEEARRQYEEASSLAKKLGFTEGVANARAGLKRMKDMGKKQA